MGRIRKSDTKLGARKRNLGQQLLIRRNWWGYSSRTTQLLDRIKLYLVYLRWR